MSVASKIIDGITETVESFLEVDAPVGPIELVDKTLPVDRTCRIREGGRQDKFAGSAVIFERSHELAAKHPRGSSDRDEEAVSTFTKFEIPGKTGTGDDAVDMRMEGKVLAPCMEYLDDAGLGAKIAPVTSQSQKGLSSCLVKQ